MAAKDAVEFLIEDHGDKNPASGFRKDFAEDLPYKSMLQRNGGNELSDLLDKFDWRDDADKWVEEYEKSARQRDRMKLVRYRRCACFCIGGWRELNEDFGRCDVSCLRDIRTPLVTSRSPLKAAKDEFDE